MLPGKVKHSRTAHQSRSRTRTSLHTHGSLQGSTAQGGVAPGRCGAVRTWAWPTHPRPMCGSTHPAKARKRVARSDTPRQSARQGRDGASARRTGTTRGVRQIPIRRCAIAPTERGDTEPPPHPRSLELPSREDFTASLTHVRTTRESFGNLTTTPNRTQDPVVSPAWSPETPSPCCCAYKLALRVAMAELQSSAGVV